jgi:hypothetical protein
VQVQVHGRRALAASAPKASRAWFTLRPDALCVPRRIQPYSRQDHELSSNAPRALRAGVRKKYPSGLQMFIQDVEIIRSQFNMNPCSLLSIPNPIRFARACARHGVLVVGEEMKGLMPNGLTDGPRTNTDNGGNCPEMSGATVSDRHLSFQSSRSRQSYRVVGGGADPVDGSLRPTARLSAIGTFARSTRARQANRFAERPEFCDQYARDRGSAETVPSSSRRALPGRKLQFTNPFIFLCAGRSVMSVPNWPRFLPIQRCSAGGQTSNTIAHFALDFERKESVCGGCGPRA